MIFLAAWMPLFPRFNEVLQSKTSKVKNRHGSRFLTQIRAFLAIFSSWGVGAPTYEGRITYLKVSTFYLGEKSEEIMLLTSTISDLFEFTLEFVLWIFILVIAAIGYFVAEKIFHISGWWGCFLGIICGFIFDTIVFGVISLFFDIRNSLKEIEKKLSQKDNAIIQDNATTEPTVAE